MRVLLTGGTGFLGTHVAETLVKRGHSVHATVRDGSDVRRLNEIGATLRHASLETGEGLAAALDGIDAVIHAAGGGRVTSPEGFRRQNLLTTTVLIDAITKHAPALKRFVLASSITAAPGAVPTSVERGNHDDPPPRSQYGASKRAAEDATLAIASRVPVTIVRLPALYGPGDTRWLSVIQPIAYGMMPTLGARAPMSMLYATDAASAMVRPIEVEHTSGRIYSPEDGEPRTQDQIGRVISEALGVRPIRVVVPRSVLDAAATLSEWMGARFKTRVFLTHDKVGDLLADGWACDSRPMRDEMGWTSEVNLYDGVCRTARWAIDEHLL